MSATWEPSTIGTLFEIGAGKSVTPKSRGTEPRYPFLRTANVFWGHIDLAVVDQMHLTPSELEEKALKPGDLLVCEGGDIGRAAIWQGGLQVCAFQNHLHRLRPRSDEIIPEFYRYYLEAGVTMLGLLDGVGNRTTIPNLSRSRLAELEAPKPPRDEQRKIALLLGKLQAAINVEGELIQTTRALKRSALHWFFTRGTRGEQQKQTEIGPLPESWNVVPLSSQREFLQYGTSAKCSPVVRGIPVLRIPNIVGGAIDTTDLKYAEFPEAEMEKLRLANGDVLFVRTNGQRHLIGRCAVYKGSPVQSAFASYLIRARFKPNTVDSDYFQYYTETDTGRSFLAGQANGAADGKFNLNTQAINSALVPLPSNPAEQGEVTTRLAAIDAKLAHHESRQKLLSELFRTLLRDLMTARLRVTDLDLTALSS